MYYKTLIWAIFATAFAGASEANMPLINLPTYQVHGSEKDAVTTVELPFAQSQAVATVTTEDLIDSPLYTAEDVLRQLPGIYVCSQFTGTSQARFIARGFGISGTPPIRGVRLLQDGIPMTLPDGHFLPQNIDYRCVRGVEVSTASSSLSKSIGSLGGAIDFHTYPGNMETGFRIRSLAGSYAKRQLNLSSFHADETSRSGISMTHSAQNGYRSQNKEKAFFINGIQEWKIDDDASLQVLATHTKVVGELSGPLSMSQFEVDPTSISLQKPYILRDKPFRNIQVSRIGAKYLKHSEASSLELKSWCLYTDYRVFRPIANEGLDFLSIAPGAAVSYTRTTEHANLLSRFKIDVEAYLEDRPTRRARLESGKMREIQSDHDMKSGFAAVTLSRDFILNDESFLKLSLQPQTHWRKVNETLNNIQLPEIRYSNHFNSVAARMEAGHRFSQLLNAWGAISYQSEPPILNDLVGAVAKKFEGQGKRLIGASLNDLKAQSTTLTELGINGENSQFQYTLLANRSTTSNEIIRTRPPEGPDVTKNSGSDIIHQGIECSLNWRLIKPTGNFRCSVDLKTSFNLNDFHFEGDQEFGDNFLPAVPKVMLQTELRVSDLPAHTTIILNSTYLPDGLYVDYANTLKTPGYTLYSIQAGWQISDRFRAFVSVHNLFDKSYINSVAPQSGLENTVTTQTPAIFPGEGRTISVGFDCQF